MGVYFPTKLVLFTSSHSLIKKILLAFLPLTFASSLKKIFEEL